MEYHYCELCDSPIKGEIHYLFCVSSEELIKGMYHFGRKGKYPEICSECRKIVEKLYKDKKTGLKKITDEIERWYNLASRDKRK